MQEYIPLSAGVGLRSVRTEISSDPSKVLLERPGRRLVTVKSVAMNCHFIECEVLPVAVQVKLTEGIEAYSVTTTLRDFGVSEVILTSAFFAEERRERIHYSMCLNQACTCMHVVRFIL